MVLPVSHKISRVSWYSGIRSEMFRFHLRDNHPLWCNLPVASAARTFYKTRNDLTRNPLVMYRKFDHKPEFGLFPIRSPLLREYSCAKHKVYFLFLRLLWRFSSPSTPQHSILAKSASFKCSCSDKIGTGFPIRKFPDRRMLSSFPRLFVATPRPSSVSLDKAFTVCLMPLFCKLPAV